MKVPNRSSATATPQLSLSRLQNEDSQPEEKQHIMDDKSIKATE